MDWASCFFDGFAVTSSVSFYFPRAPFSVVDAEEATTSITVSMKLKLLIRFRHAGPVPCMPAN
jgi:hypothetical protein